MHEPPVLSSAQQMAIEEEIAYDEGQELANEVIARRSPLRIDAHRRVVQNLWDNAAEDTHPASLSFLRGLLDILTEYQHRGDETP